MRVLVAVLFISLLSGAVSGRGIRTWCPKLQADIRECIEKDVFDYRTRKQLFSIYMDGSLRHLLLNGDAGCIYRVKTRLKPVAECLHSKMTRCIPTKYENFLPSLAKVKKGIDYICNNYEVGFDKDCWNNSETSVASCVLMKLSRETFNTSSEADIKNLLCKRSRYMQDCYEQEVSLCPRKTLEMLKAVELFDSPEACDAPWPSVSTPDMTASGAVLRRPVCPKLPALANTCIKSNAYSDDIRRKLGFLASSSIFEAISLLNFLEAADTLCEKRKISGKIYAKDVMQCLYIKMDSCVPTDYDDILPSRHNFIDGMKYICKSHKADFDKGCWNTHKTAVAACVSMKLSRETFNTTSVAGMKDFLCKKKRCTLDCYEQELGLCPNKTIDMLEALEAFHGPYVCKACAPTGLRGSLFLMLCALAFLQKLL